MSTFRTLRRRLLGSATALTMAAGLVTAFPSGSEAVTAPAVAAVPAVTVVGEPVQFVAVGSDPTYMYRYASLFVCRTPDFVAQLYNSWCAGGAWATAAYGSVAPATIATYTPVAADIGTNPYFAFVCDINGGGTCDGPFDGSFVVAPGVTDAFVSDDCDTAGTNVVTGFVGDQYVKARWKQSNGQTRVCVAAEQSGEHMGGRLVFGGGATPGAVQVDDGAASAAACAADPNNVPVQSGTVLGGQPYWIHVTPSPTASSDAAWVCIRFTSTLGLRLRLSAADAVPFLDFTADPGHAHAPAYTTALWPVAGPSATCSAAPQRRRYLDVEVGDTRSALYGWSEAPTEHHLCLRAGGAGGAGGRLTVASDAASSVTLGSSTAPCPFDVVTRSDAPSYGLYISDPSAVGLPVSACGAVAGTATSVTVSSPDAGGATWSPDPA